MDKKYKVTCAIANSKMITHLQSGLFDTAEQARDFADKLLAEGMIVGYRVSYSLDDGNSFYFHEYVKYTPFDIGNNRELIKSYNIP